MTLNTDVSADVDVNELIDQIGALIHSSGVSPRPIEVVIKNKSDVTMYSLSTQSMNGNLTLDGTGMISQEFAPTEDLVYGIKSQGNGSTGINVMQSTTTQTINNIESTLVAIFYYHYDGWPHSGISTYGSVTWMPTITWEALVSSAGFSAWVEKIQKQYHSETKQDSFTNPPNAEIEYAGNIAVNVTVNEGKDTESMATFIIGATS